MLLKRDILSKLCDEIRNQKRQIVFTNGCFDIIHAGHVQYLEKSKKLGDILIVGLNSNNSVKRLKGDNRPLNSELDRAAVLLALCSVDYVCIFEEDTPYELIKLIRPDILVKGADYTEDNVVGSDIVNKNGGRVVLMEYLEGRSTSAVIEKMRNKAD